MRRIFPYIIVFCLMFSGASAACVLEGPFLILNAENFSRLPRNFRTTSDLPEAKNYNPLGLADLHMSGSAEFSRRHFIRLLETVPELEWVIDLRQESHGFVSGFAVSWYRNHNWANFGKTNDEVEREQAERLSKLRDKKLIFIQDESSNSQSSNIVAQRREYLIPFPLILPANDIVDEEALISDFKIKYKRFYVPDHQRPRNEEVDRFVAFVTNLPQNTHLHFHCAAGMGRTTSFMAMYDMMHNANKVSFEEIINRQYRIGGVNLHKMEDPTSYKYHHTRARYAFLKQFYYYAKENVGDQFNTPWSMWIKNNGTIEHAY